MLCLARQGQPLPLPGDAPSESTGQPGSGPGATGRPAGDGGFGPNFFLFVLLAVTAMIVFSMWGQRRDKKKREAMILAIKKHDRVQTIGGVIGSIVEVKKDQVVLKVDESSNTRITFARSAVQQVLGENARLAPSQGEASS